MELSDEAKQHLRAAYFNIRREYLDAMVNDDKKTAAELNEIAQRIHELIERVHDVIGAAPHA